MKTRFIAALAVLALLAIGTLNGSLTEPTSAQDKQRPRTDAQDKQRPRTESEAKEETAPNQAAKIKLGGGLSATCFCRVTANGSWVAEPSKGGYIQPIQKEACRNYCRGLWDAGSAQRKAWAQLLSNACGRVDLAMYAKLGTLGYEQVRSGSEYGINGTQLVTTCTCPVGQTVSKAFGNTKYCITPTPTQLPVPDQVLQGGFLIQSQLLYTIHGNASCVTKCQ